jgi:hypothetical protein
VSRGSGRGQRMSHDEALLAETGAAGAIRGGGVGTRGGTKGFTGQIVLQLVWILVGPFT